MIGWPASGGGGASVNLTSCASIGSSSVFHSSMLARAVPGSHGLNGLALFLVPKCVPDPERGERENYSVERAEHKVCINGSPTCALAFQDTCAEIMGSPGDGWRQITTFMNEAPAARIARAGHGCAPEFLRVRTGVWRGAQK